MVIKHSVPNRNNHHNYMLDTSAYNHIIQSAEKMNTVKTSILLGFCYYSTAIQHNELAGQGAKTYNKECISVTDYITLPEFKQKIDTIDKDLTYR